MPKREKTSKSFFAERRGFVEVETLPMDIPAVTVAPRKTRKERQPIDEGDRPESRLRLRKGGEVKQLANKSINYSAFVIAILIPTAWLLSANLLQFILSGQLFLSSYRLWRWRQEQRGAVLSLGYECAPSVIFLQARR